MVIGGSVGVADHISWTGTENESFSVSSAYSLLAGEGELGPCMVRFFERLWRVMAPERARVFLWLVGNQAVLTNAERHRRHMADFDVCQLCRGASESLIHVLRDCPAMTGIWLRLVPKRKRQTFFATSLLEWFFMNLEAKQGLEHHK